MGGAATFVPGVTMFFSLQSIVRAYSAPTEQYRQLATLPPLPLLRFDTGHNAIQSCCDATADTLFLSVAACKKAITMFGMSSYISKSWALVKSVSSESLSHCSRNQLPSSFSSMSTIFSTISNFAEARSATFWIFCDYPNARNNFLCKKYVWSRVGQ